MLVHVTGVAGSGKSTLSGELLARGYVSEDADEGFCAWFDKHGSQVPNVPLHKRTAAWYADHSWLLLREPVAELANRCEGQVGFLMGVFANVDTMNEYFDAKYYLTLSNDLVQRRLRNRDGDGYATRFAGSPQDWQDGLEAYYTSHGYSALDATAPLAEVADNLLALVCT